MVADMCGVTCEPVDLELEVAVRNLMWLRESHSCSLQEQEAFLLCEPSL